MNAYRLNVSPRTFLIRINLPVSQSFCNLLCDVNQGQVVR